MQIKEEILMLHLSPSITSADFCRLGEDVRLTTEAGADYIHFDVMDGVFVPQISFGMPVLASLKKATDAVMDIHLMIVEPDKYVPVFAELGADIITVHYEACTHLDRVIDQIKACGAKAAVAINPATPISVLDLVLHKLDMVLIMTVNPGYGGQKLIPYCLDKVRALSEVKKARGYDFDIQVDGGINLENASQAIEAGANVLVAGSCIFGGDITEKTKGFMEIFSRY